MKDCQVISSRDNIAFRKLCQNYAGRMHASRKLGTASDCVATGRVTQTTHISQQRSQTGASNNKGVAGPP